MFTGKGDLFGSDLAYVDDEQDTIAKSTSDVKALTYCDLQCMSLSGLKQTLRMYPEFAKQCATDLLHDLTYNLRDGFIDPDDDTIDLPAVTLQLSNNTTPTIKVYSHMLTAAIKRQLFADAFFFLSFLAFIQVYAIEETSSRHQTSKTYSKVTR